MSAVGLVWVVFQPCCVSWFFYVERWSPVLLIIFVLFSHGLHYDNNILLCLSMLCERCVTVDICGSFGRWYFLLCDVAQSSSVLSPARLLVTLWPEAHQAPYPSPPSGVCSDWCLLSWRCCLPVSPSAVPVSSCPQSLPASGSFPASWHFSSGLQGIEASSAASVLVMNIQGLRSPLGLTDFIYLQSKGLSFQKWCFILCFIVHRGCWEYNCDSKTLLDVVGTAF